LKNIKDVSMGPNHSAAITNDGNLYTFGCGKYGKLGHGDLKD
jgi:E3 ubiquitin-protein ligase HERC2